MDKETKIANEWNKFLEWCEQNGFNPKDSKVLSAYANETKSERK
jgi:hypothetical protein